MLIDDASRHITIEFLKMKTQATQKVKDYITYLEARGVSPCAIKMDWGTEFLNKNLQSWGMELQLTAPYSPPQNGMAEWMNHMLVELVQAMIVDTGLPEFLWEPAVAHTVFLQNMAYTLTPKLRNQMPYQIWYGKKPNVAHLREFGAPVWVLLQGQNVQCKMLPKSQCQAYIRYNKGSKAVKYYNAATRNVLTARNFHFLQPVEQIPPEEIGINPRELKGGDTSPSEGGKESGTQRDNLRKRKHQEEDNLEIDPNELWKTRGIRPDYRYMNNPFPDEEEAGIIEVREEAYTVIPDDNCGSLRSQAISRVARMGVGDIH